MLIVWSTRPKSVPLLTSLSNTWFAPVFFIHDCTTPISQELLQPSITKMGLKITCPKLYSNLPGTNEFISCHTILGTWHIAGGCCGRHRLSYCRTPTGRFRGGRCGEGRGFASHIWGHTKPRVIMMPILSSLVAAEVVVMTTYGASSDDTVGITTTLDFQWHYGDVTWASRYLKSPATRLHDQQLNKANKVSTRPPNY